MPVKREEECAMIGVEFVRNYFLGVEFSWIAFWIAAAAVLVAGLTSVDKKQQWGIVILELLLFPITSGMIVPYVHLPICAYVPLLIGAAMISWHLFKYWWPEKGEAQTLRELLDDVCDWLDGENWHTDDRPKLREKISLAGWINLAFMTIEWLMLGVYLFSPTISASVVKKVVALLVALVIVAVIKPSIVLDWKISKRITILSVGSIVVLCTAIALVSWIKLITK